MNYQPQFLIYNQKHAYASLLKKLFKVFVYVCVSGSATMEYVNISLKWCAAC